MTTQEIFPALLAFLFGLLAKFLYDLWAESRQKKSIVFTKKVINSFSVNMLEEKLRERAEVLFDQKAIKSVHIVSVEVENAGLRAVKNQAFTVRFSDKAQILGVPTSKSSSEDLRYVKDEQVEKNAHRFVIHLLQKRRKLAWEFVVINTDTKDFIIEHGISPQSSDFTDADLDVGSTVISSKIQLDLVSQIKRALFIVFLTVALTIVTEPITNIFGNGASLALRATSILLLYLLFNAASKIIQLYIENKSLSEVAKDQAAINASLTIEGYVSGSIVLGNQNSVSSTVPAALDSAEPPIQILDSKHKTIEDNTDSHDLLLTEPSE